MTYATIMTLLDLGGSHAATLNVAGALAERLGTSVLGVAASQILQLAYGDAYLSGDLVEQVRQQTEKLMAEAESEFRTSLSSRVQDLEWRSAETWEPLCDYFARQARGADLIVAPAGADAILHSESRLNTSDLLMRAGRPVLLVPPGSAKVTFDRVLVGWKETREARRAVLDALPLLQAARHVVVVEIAHADHIAEAREHLVDVANWLGRHGVVVETDASEAQGSDVHSLTNKVNEHDADLIVAGAYGHNRLREWALGGVTCDLLLSTRRLALLSH